MLRLGGIRLGRSLGILFAPLLLVLLILSLIVMVIGMIGSSSSNINKVGRFFYSERLLKNYAETQYTNHFIKANNYENNILIAFLIDDEYSTYYTTAHVGSNVKPEICQLFGNDMTPFGREIAGNLSSYYENSLGSNLSSIVEGMTDSVVNLSLGSSFISEEGGETEHFSKIYNESNIININEEIVNNALKQFSQETDISLVIVVDDINEVFDNSVQNTYRLRTAFAIILSGVSLYLLIRALRGKERSS